MNDISSFLITKKWPAQHPGRIQLYSLPTPNGVKASIMLEETALPYEPHRVSFEDDEQRSVEFWPTRHGAFWRRTPRGATKPFSG